MSNRILPISLLFFILCATLPSFGQTEKQIIVNGFPVSPGILLLKPPHNIFGFWSLPNNPTDIEILPSKQEYVIVTQAGDFLFYDRYGEQFFSTMFEGLNDVDVLQENIFLLTSRVGKRVFVYYLETEEQVDIPFSFAGPTDADLLSNGNYLVCDAQSNRILEVTPDGEAVWQHSDGLAQPMDALRLGNGHTLVSDFDHHRILEINPQGHILTQRTGFDHPLKMTLLPNGDILVADGDQKRLVKITQSGGQRVIHDDLNYIQSAVFQPERNLYLCAIQDKFPAPVTAPAQVTSINKRKFLFYKFKEFFNFIQNPVFLLVVALISRILSWLLPQGTIFSKIFLILAYGLTLGIAYDYLTEASASPPYYPKWCFWCASFFLAAFTFWDARHSLIPKKNWQSESKIVFPFSWMWTIFLIVWPVIALFAQYYHLRKIPDLQYTLPWYIPMAVWGIGVYFLFRQSKGIHSETKGERKALQLGSVRLAVPFSTGSVSEEDYEEESQVELKREIESPAAEYWANTSVIIIILLAACLYIVGMTQVPTDVHGDEGEVGLYSIEFRESGEWNIFDLGWYHISNFFFLLPGWGMWLFGDDLFGIRMVSSLIGVATIPLFYLLSRRLVLPVPAAIATFLFASSTFMIHFCRMGIGYNQTTFFTVAGLYFLIRGLQDHDGKSYCAAGLICGLSIISYQAGKLLPPLAISTLLLLFITRRIDFRRAAVGIVTFFIALWVSISPIIGNYWYNPTAFFSRASAVSIFSEEGRKWIKIDYPPNTPMPEIIEGQFKRSFLGTISHADKSPFLSNRQNGGMLDPLPAILFTAGCMVLLFSLLNTSSLLLLYWTVITIIAGSVLTNGAPAYQRLVGAIPFLLLIAAPVFYAIIQQFSREFRWNPKVRTIMICLIAFIILVMGMHRYFHQIMLHPQFTDDSTRIAKYIRDGGPTRYNYLFGYPYFYFSYGNIRFLAPFAEGENIQNPKEFLQHKVPRRGPVSFILVKNNRQYINDLRRLYPGGKEEHHYNIEEKDPFTTYEVNL